MDNISELYKKGTEQFNEMLSHPVTVTLKLDGAAFQVYDNEETGEVEYRKKGKDYGALGDKIDSITKMFSKHYVNSINTIEQHKDDINPYRFLRFEVDDKNMWLLGGVDKENKILDNDAMNELAVKIGAKTAPVLFKGQLSDEQREKISRFAASPQTAGNYKQFIYDLFGEYKGFPVEWETYDSEIEGVVMRFEIDGKDAMYKMVNPKFAVDKENGRIKAAQDMSNSKADYDKLANLLVGWMKENVETGDGDRLKSLNRNFKKLLKDYKLLNELMNIAVKLPQYDFEIVDDYMDSEIERSIKSMGKTLKTIYINYITLFYSERVDSPYKSTDLQTQLNEIIGKL